MTNLNQLNQDQLKDLHKGYDLIKQVLDAFCPKGKNIKLVPKAVTNAPACTDTENAVYINPQIICGLADPAKRRRAIGLILHELGHCYYTKDDKNRLEDSLYEVNLEIGYHLKGEQLKAVSNKIEKEFKLLDNCLEDPRIEFLMTAHAANVQKILEATQSDFTNQTKKVEAIYEDKTLLNILGFYCFYMLNSMSYKSIKYTRILKSLSEELKARGINIRNINAYVRRLFASLENCNTYFFIARQMLRELKGQIVLDYVKRAQSITEEANAQAQNKQEEKNNSNSNSSSSQEDGKDEKSSSTTSSSSKGQKDEQKESSGSKAQSSSDDCENGQECNSESSQEQEQKQENDNNKSGSSSNSSSKNNCSNKSSSDNNKAENSSDNKSEDSNSSNCSPVSQEIEKLEETTSDSLKEEFEKLCQANSIEVQKVQLKPKKKVYGNIPEEMVELAELDYREPSDRPNYKFHSKEEWESIFENYAKTSNSLVAKVKRELLAYTRKAPNSFGKKGKRLANTRIAKVAQGIYTKNPFVAKGNSECLDTHVSVMFDCSGSMDTTDKRQALEKSAALLASTLGRCESENLISSMFTYSYHNYQVKKPMQKVTANVFAERYIADWGGTDGWECIVRMYQEMMQYNKTRKVMIVVTDGVWRNNDSKLWKILEESNIELYGIMIGDSEFQNCPEWTASFRAKVPEQLDEIMQELFVQILHQNKQQLKKFAS